MSNRHFWDHERIEGPISAEEYNGFWAVIDTSFQTDEDWKVFTEAEQALRNND